MKRRISTFALKPQLGHSIPDFTEHSQWSSITPKGMKIVGGGSKKILAITRVCGPPPYLTKSYSI